jgi:pyruvate ferredoxin oxidoreductase alpha subunit
MKQIIEGSKAIALAAARSGIDVVGAYPITPSTHIVEELSRLQAEHGFEFVPVESELSAISVLIGASATGARTFTATSSQGLLLMTEALFNASGMRLPIVMAVANRAVSAPLNIWNDWQDSMSLRDSGWMQFYCRNNQEAVDTVIQAFQIAEKALVPAMVCIEGYYLTHEVSPVDVPSKEEIKEFLPPFKPQYSLDVDAPYTFGTYATPQYYQGIREMQQNAVLSAQKEIESAAKDFGKKFGRTQYPLLEETNLGKTDSAIVTMSTLAENTELVLEKNGNKTKGVGLLRLKCFRPFPKKEIVEALSGKKNIVVVEKCFSAGGGGILGTEVKAALQEEGVKARVLNVICGLGGKDVSLKEIEKILGIAGKGKTGTVWL